MYKIGQKIAVGNKQFILFADRIITNISDKKPSEFIFAKGSIDQENSIFFVADFDSISKNSIGFWHTLLLNNLIDFNQDIIYQVLDENQDGQYLSINDRTVSTGPVVGGEIIAADNNLNKMELSAKNIKIKRIKVIVTPQQQVLDQRKHNKHVFAVLLLLIVGVYSIGYLLIEEQLKTEINLINKLATIQGKINRPTKVKKVVQTEQNYAHDLLPKLIFLSQHNIWSAKIDFTNKNNQAKTKKTKSQPKTDAIINRFYQDTPFKIKQKKGVWEIEL